MSEYPKIGDFKEWMLWSFAWPQFVEMKKDILKIQNG